MRVKRGGADAEAQRKQKKNQGIRIAEKQWGQKTEARRNTSSFSTSNATIQKSVALQQTYQR
jgi:hypothetical protein